MGRFVTWCNTRQGVPNSSDQRKGDERQAFLRLGLADHFSRPGGHCDAEKSQTLLCARFNLPPDVSLASHPFWDGKTEWLARLPDVDLWILGPKDHSSSRGSEVCNPVNSCLHCVPENAVRPSAISASRSSKLAANLAWGAKRGAGA